jgi:hypothetical protein
MKKHIISVLSIKDLYKKMQLWAENNNFDVVDNDITGDNFLIKLNKNYGKTRKFSFLLLFLSMFLGAIFSMVVGLNPESGASSFIVLLSIGGYIGYHFYMKNKGLIISFTIKGMKEEETNVYINCESEINEAKVDLTHIYNHLVD